MLLPVADVANIFGDIISSLPPSIGLFIVVPFIVFVVIAVLKLVIHK